MINANMRNYDFFTYGDNDLYGQPQLSKEPVGKIKMAINLTSQSIQENINYKDSQYIGLTQATVDDTYVICYNDKRLKVLYIDATGRYTQVFMSEL